MSPHRLPSAEGRWLPLIAIATVVVALALSVVATLVLDARAAQQCPPGTNWDEDAGQCVQQAVPSIDIGDPPVQVTIPPDIDLQITQPPQPQLTAPPIQVTVPPPVQVTIPPDIQILPTVTPDIGEPPPAMPQIEAIEVTKWECPPGLDPDSDLATLTASCTTPAATAFTMSHVWPGGIEPVSTTGYVEWTGLDAPPYFSPHFIGEEVPPGYGTPIPWCGLFSPGATDPTLTRRSLDEYGMVVVDPPDTAGQHFYCEWFNMPVGNEIVITKLVCPPGTDLGEDIDAWLAACADDTTGGYEFTLTTAAGSFTETTVVGTGDAATDGNVSWQGVAPGPFSVQETAPAGAPDPRVWCGSFPLDVLPHPESVPLDPIAAPGGRWEGTFDDGPIRYVCYWVNIQSMTTLALESTNAVEVVAYLCSPDVSRDLLNTELEAICDPAILAAVTLGYADLRLTQETSVDGSVRWDSVPAGDWSLSSAVPVGAEPFRAGCAYAAWPDEAVADGRVEAPGIEARFNAPDGPVEITGTLDGVGYTLRCTFFSMVVVEPPPSVVTIKKSDCATVPAGFRSLEEWLAACPDIGEGGFTLTDAAGARSLATDADGNAVWTDVASGPFTIIEDPMLGYGEPVVWCQLRPPRSEDGGLTIALPTNVPVSGGMIEGAIREPGTEVTCFWFNIPDPTPDDGSTVFLSKRFCPADVAPTESDFSVLFLECTGSGDGTVFDLETSTGTSSRTVAGGMAYWTDVPTGDFTITESSLPAGAAPPAWTCGGWYLNDAGERFTILERDSVAIGGTPGVITGSIEVEGTTIQCRVYDFSTAGDGPDRTVTVLKWNCPAGTDPLGDEPVACRAAGDGVEFTLTDTSGTITRTTSGGRATWTDVAPGDLTLAETIPPGFGEPLVRCGFDAIPHDGGSHSEGMSPVPSTGGSVTREADYAAFAWVCNFFDVHEGDGFAEILLTKRTCPPGYDVAAPGTDPPTDCSDATDGVAFNIVGDDGSSATDVTVGGAVGFTPLDPGTYQITETVPDGVGSSFIWDCVGDDIPAVHPHPLASGDTLTITVAPDDDVTCDWYNVPEPEDGSLTVEKHACRTETFVSEVDCEIFEHGAAFELHLVVEGGAFERGMTDPTGRYTWAGIPAGIYRLEETGADPCHVASARLDAEGLLTVTAGDETIVRVYNCVPDTPPGDPDTPLDDPGKPPTEWPNTGAAPAEAASLAQATQEATPAATPAIGADEPFFPVSCIDNAGATPAATPTDVGCPRGAVPASIAIEAAGVDTAIEVVEVVNGVMQAPTGPNVAAWYKETGRLGEPTNMVVAGHLNWWNVPEGVFYHLAELEEGDRIEVTGENGATHVFEVQWVRQQSALAPPSAETIGPTDAPSLTLITCGGPWDSASAEYTERTVVRAIQVEIVAGDDAS